MDREHQDSTITATAAKGDATPTRPLRYTVMQVLPAMGNEGGVERGTVEVADAIVKAGGRALVVSSGGPKEFDLKRVGARHVTLPVNSKNPFVMRANIARLEAVIKAEKVDIVHARSRAPAWSAYFAAKNCGARFVTTFHGTYSAGNWFKRRYNAIMTRGDRVIAISHFIAGHLRQLYGVAAAKVRIIHRGVDLDKFDPARVSAERVVQLAGRWRLDDGLPVIMLPGRLTRWKGQGVLIDAIAKLGRRDVRCVLVGSDAGRGQYRKELETLIRRNDLGGVVRIVDHCADMPAAYMLADVVVSASTDPEAFGRVVAEAQALGRPVVAPDHGGAREIILSGDTGWLVAPGDADALAEGLKKALALGDPDRAEMAARAIARVHAHFSKAAMCAKTLDVYDELMGRAPGGDER
ncbi:glycosyltransferase family 4 protein [Varunaivibrio sulfuroxidans]|uniref:Glycosyltransferase involved in cell wall biosynthesis n=1 Tax=Varunaivibrio sulfuroxidans TaxID=1773489 RepID=A0A4R3J826_9PROT|nr:glycosyltransferase family 4 protein [Varunaivibrio sulfuroxidans]TCS60660.1 glycosyltransferase involved in cell wall biosynthesis [Varunaivibrio sulfuroxidans]WES30151.1 glycosyltransferase family 4 protein [Varunaivibrio sulfuroxidans]